MFRTGFTAVAASVVMFLSAQPAMSQARGEEVYKTAFSLSPAERQTYLETEAKKEGELTIYTPNGNMDAFKVAFEKKYPFVTVNVYRAHQKQVLQRVLREAGANKVVNDITDATAAELRILGGMGYFTPYQGAVLADLRPEAKEAPEWTATRFSSYVVAWNTDAVPEGSQPKTFADLVDPKWMGKIGMADADYIWYAALKGHLAKGGMSEADLAAFFRALTASSRVVKGHTLATELLGAGQIVIAPSLYTHNVDEGKFDKKMPISSAPIIEPLILEASGQGLMKDAPNPAAALLFTDWMLTDGQKILISLYRVPANQTVEGGDKVIPAGVQTIGIAPEIYEDSKRWSKEYDDLLRSAAGQ